MIRLNATAIPLPVARWADGKDCCIVSSNPNAKGGQLKHTSGVYA